MPGITFNLLEYESKSWKRALEFMKEENIHLKNQLSVILQGQVGKNILEHAEDFQNQFINTDELVLLLRNDIGKLEQLSATITAEPASGNDTINIYMKIIRNNISVAESRCAKLKMEFNCCFSKKILQQSQLL